MALHFLLPAIHGRRTGGNVYNAALMQALRRGHRIVEHEEGTLTVGGLQRATSPGDAVLVDSLLVPDPRIHELRHRLPDRLVLLLVHYLDLLDPRKRRDGRAHRERERLGDFHGFVVTSRFSKHALEQAGVASERIAVVYPGVHAPENGELMARDEDAPPRLLTVASLVPGKGHGAALDALERCGDLGWTWEVVGEEGLDPPHARRFRERLARSPVGGRVRMRGARPAREVRRLYETSDLLLLASAFESCSMVTMEALAAGLPVVAFEVGGVGEHVREPGAARLIPPGDVDAFAAALRGVLSDREALHRMQAAARRNGAFGAWADAATGLGGFIERLENAPRSGGP